MCECVCSVVKDFISLASVHRILFCLLHILSCLFAPFAYYICRLVAGKSEFQFLVCFFTCLYIIIFCACLAKFHFSLCTNSTRVTRPTDITFTFCTHTLTGSNASTHTHMLILTGTRGHPKSSCLPAACQFINVVFVHVRNVCMYVSVYTSFSHVHTHT